MKDFDHISRMLDTIRKIQESTTDNPKIQGEVKETIMALTTQFKTTHEALLKSTIEQIKADKTLSEENKNELLKKLEEQTAQMNRMSPSKD